MHNYEIRLVKPQGRQVMHAGRYLGDYHAIRRAHALAQDNDRLEVWRGPHCIYREGAERGAAWMEKGHVADEAIFKAQRGE
jgi:hypothetical protein